MPKIGEQNLKLFPCNKNWNGYAAALMRCGILFCLLLVQTRLLAQQSSGIHFKKLSLNDGLSQSSVNCIAQDPFGFLWLGTQDGLNRYNGYQFQVYQHDLNDKQSISNNFIHNICVAHDSMLLIATERGVNIYNPFTQMFSAILANEKNNLGNNNVWNILKTKKNQYWVGTENDFLHFNYAKQTFTPIPLIGSTQKKPLKVRYLYEDAQERIWICTEENGVFCYNPGSKSITHFHTEGAITTQHNTIWTIVQQNPSEYWFGTNSGIDIYNEKTGRIKRFSHLLLNNQSSESTIKSLYKDANENIWIGTNGAGAFRYHIATEQLSSFKHNTSLPQTISSNVILSFFSDFTGSLWIGTEVGVNKFDINKQFFELYQKREGSPVSLSSSLIWSVYKEGKTVYIGTDEGLDKLHEGTKRISHYKLPLSAANLQAKRGIYSIFRDKKQTLWLGTDKGLYYVNEQTENILPFSLNARYPELNVRIYTVFEDRKEYLWLGTKEGLIILTPDRKEFYYFTHTSTEKQLPGNIIRVIQQDASGACWLGMDNAGLCKAEIKQGNYASPVFTTFAHDFNNPFSLSNNTILSIHIDRAGILWLGTFGGGLNKFDPLSGKFQAFTQKDGLPNNVIYGVLEDAEEQLWLTTNKGLSRYNKKNGHVLNFEQNDGLQSNEFNVGAYFAASDGAFYIGGINGLNAFYPSRIKKNQIPPKVHITGFYIFNTRIENNKKTIQGSLLKNATIKLTHKQNVISIEYAGLHYSYAEKNQYKYQLEGFDENWINAYNERKANFTNLDPGIYTFRVKACNSDGIWSDETASLTILVEPPFWKTWWFRIGLGCTLLLLVYIAYRLRLRNIESQKAELETLVQQRTAEVIHQKEKIEEQNKLLEIEKEKVEKLLLNILPEDTVEELKSKGKASARSYRTVSVMFTDFAGFTKLAESFRPKELLAELDSYFIKFDEIIQKYNIEKIKTMGDSYMCAGGIPIRNKSNPIDIVLAGLEIQRYISEMRKIKGENAWSLRIGINTGELIAGVVGTKRFAYDIWGDTVNVASRMESSGEIDKVNVSGATYEHIKEFFVCEYRGKIKAKNKGLIDMYFVHGIKPELSIDGKGIEPNEKFWKYVDLILYSSINYRKAEKFIVKMLKDKLPHNLHYHSLPHTLDVCQAIERIAIMEGVVGEEMFLLKSAALYHDSGFIEQYEKNEEIGAAMAQEALHQFGYTSEQIELIKQLILATSVPQQPKTHLEQIICDADLDYLGRDDFHEIADKLKRELLERNKIQTDKQWDEIQVKFLEAHTYFTQSAKDMRQEKKMLNLQEVKRRLQNYKE